MFTIFILSIATFGTIYANETLEVIRSEMSLEMEKFAFGATVDLLESGKKLANIGGQLEQTMNNKFGKGWMSLIDRNVGSIIVSRTITDNTRLIMRYQDHEMFLFKEKIQQANYNITDNQDNLKATVQEAIKANPVKIYSYDDRVYQIAVNAIRSYLQKNLNDIDVCTGDINCFQKISISLDKIGNDLGVDASKQFLAVTTGYVGKCFSQNDIPGRAALLFSLGQLFFEFLILDK